MSKTETKPPHDAILGRALLTIAFTTGARLPPPRTNTFQLPIRSNAGLDDNVISSYLFPKQTRKLEVAY